MTSELRDQLQSTLGSSYTLERELEGGGMSRVFVAEDTALGRAVVVKVPWLIGLETPGGNKITVSDDAKGLVLEDQNGNKITLDDNGIKIESAKDLILKASGDLKLSGTNAEVKAQSGFKASGASTAELSGAQTKIDGSATTVIKGGMVQIN